MSKQDMADRDLARKTRLQFLETELDVALTFARIADMAYSMGRADRGSRAASKARAALEQAVKFLNDVPPGRKEHLTDKLMRLSEAIATLPKPTA